MSVLNLWMTTDIRIYLMLTAAYTVAVELLCPLSFRESLVSRSFYCCYCSNGPGALEPGITHRLLRAHREAQVGVGVAGPVGDGAGSEVIVGR